MSSGPDFFAYLTNGVLPAVILGASVSGAGIAAAIVADPLKPPLSVCYSPVTCYSNLAADNVNYRENIDGAGYGGPGGGGGGIGLTLFCGRCAQRRLIPCVLACDSHIDLYIHGGPHATLNK